MAKIQLEFGQVNYEVRGTGEAAILFNHSGTSSQSWSETFLESLAEKLAVVTFDYRGTGYSNLGPAPFSLTDLAADARAILQQEGMDRAIVIGTSMGGAVAQEFVLACPEQVTALVLMGTFAGFSHFVPPDEEILKIVEDILPRWDEIDNIERWRRLLPTLYGPTFLGQYEDLALELELRGSRYTTAETVARHGNAAGKFDSYERLPSISTQTLIIHGLEDPVIPAENGRILAERIPGSEFIELEGVGHLPAAEKPGEVAGLILNFAERSGVNV